MMDVYEECFDNWNSFMSTFISAGYYIFIYMGIDCVGGRILIACTMRLTANYVVLCEKLPVRSKLPYVELNICFAINIWRIQQCIRVYQQSTVLAITAMQHVYERSANCRWNVYDA